MSSNQSQQAYELLQQNQLWGQIFDRNPAVQLIVDPASRVIIDANQPACRFYGYPREALRGRSLDEIEIGAGSSETDDETLLMGFEHRLRDGQVRQVKVTASIVDNGAGALLHLIVFDITKRRRAEAAEKGQRTLTSALIKTAATLVDSLDLPEVLDRILEQVQLVLPNDYVNIMLVEGDEAVVVRSRGYERLSDMPAIHRARADLYSTPTLRWMIDHKLPLVIPDVLTDLRWVDYPQTHPWLRSYLGVPIRMGGTIIGFLNFDSGIVNRFSNYDPTALQAFADQAGSAIRNARLFDRVRKQATIMELQANERGNQLDYERKLFRRILDAMAEGVIYSELDSEGALQAQFVNEAMIRMLGFSEAEIRHPRVQNIALERLARTEIPGVRHGIADRAVMRALHNRHVIQSQAVLTRETGAHIEIAVENNPIAADDGRLLGAVTVVRDVSQAADLERQRSQFLARASHELRTPITNIKTRLYLLRRQPERLPQDLHVLEQVTTQMSRLVEMLLDMSRLERGQAPLRLNKVIAQKLVSDAVEAHRPTIEGRNQQIVIEVPPEALSLSADADRLTQVLNNLIANASSYTPTGGVIRVGVRASVVAETNEPAVCFDVIDTGIGIAPDYQKEIFKPFYRINDDGSGIGLGLSIAREIVDLHGGTIFVQSTPEQGSHFCFVLPVSQPSGPTPARTSP